MDLNSVPQCNGLVAIKEVLHSLLSVCTGGIVNQKPLEQALRALVTSDETLLPRSADHRLFAENLGHRLRIALAHIRRLKRQPDTLRRCLKGCTVQVVGEMQRLLEAYVVEGTDTEARKGDTQDSADGDAQEAPTDAEARPGARKLTGASPQAKAKGSPQTKAKKRARIVDDDDSLPATPVKRKAKGEAAQAQAATEERAQRSPPDFREFSLKRSPQAKAKAKAEAKA